MQQFVTACQFLFEHNLGSDYTLNMLKNIIAKHLDEFSDVELLLLKKGLVQNKLVKNEHMIAVIDEKLMDI